jgi:hypothetical protein
MYDSKADTFHSKADIDSSSTLKKLKNNEYSIAKVQSKYSSVLENSGLRIDKTSRYDENVT